MDRWCRENNMNESQQTKTKMQAALEHFKQELKGLRSNRANPAIVENVIVEIYDGQMRLKELASITAPEARQILISPFDPKTAASIAKSIERANLNLQPVVDGHVVRINIPPMDEATRKEIVKQGKKKAEDAKVVVREIRRKTNELVRKMKADGDMTEDEMKRTEKTVQELTDQFCKDIDALFVQKEKEILTV
jgi:ribosome recycling factor